ncbi:hypothetical protein SAMN05216483_0892 [Streptomyces sp. 2131.1]|uniref:hypothetical protein n=1 Tax=Streptomyces sp. 2131.1 TaxID=1855346 RepID=UPI00089C3DA6|nr:hypothetical protein [Streptomyces sp. 2131.1]SEC02017.1 hypothetical protein SAMN05216483_0892 [Streptomyces sp. 2131.1]
MTDDEPQRPTLAVPPVPEAPPLAVAVGPRRNSGRRTLIIAAVVAALLIGGGATWWALADDGAGDAMSHVEISGGKVIDSENSLLDDDEECDDTDDLSYNDCDADSAYEYIYKVTNEGDEPANYAVILNAFDEDGDFIGQTYFSATHLLPGKSKADTGEFNKYSEFPEDDEVTDIASVKVAHVERVALAN